MSSNDRTLIAATAALLDQGQTLNRLARWLTVSAVAGLLAVSLATAPNLASISFLIASILAGLAELHYVLRVGFDARLFRHLLESAESDAPDLSGLDRALSRLGLIRTPTHQQTPDQPPRSVRSLDARAIGACRLLYAQAISLALQAVFIVAGATIAAFR
jgi:hypothetical protein